MPGHVFALGWVRCRKVRVNLLRTLLRGSNVNRGLDCLAVTALSSMRFHFLSPPHRSSLPFAPELSGPFPLGNGHEVLSLFLPVSKFLSVHVPWNAPICRSESLGWLGRRKMNPVFELPVISTLALSEVVETYTSLPDLEWRCSGTAHQCRQTHTFPSTSHLEMGR